MKWGCGVAYLREHHNEECVVYSFRSQHERGYISLELIISELLSECQVHIFQSVAADNDIVIDFEVGRVKMYRWDGEESLSNIMDRFGHSHLDILNVNIEREQIPVFFGLNSERFWPSIGQMNLRMKNHAPWSVINFLENQSLRIYNVGNQPHGTTFAFIQKEWSPHNRQYIGMRSIPDPTAHSETMTVLEVESDAAVQEVQPRRLLNEVMPHRIRKSVPNKKSQFSWTKESEDDFLSFALVDTPSSSSSDSASSDSPDDDVSNEPVEWWKDQHINGEYKEQFESMMQQMYEEQFDAAQYDILTVRTKVGDETVRFKMYGPKPTTQTTDIVTATIRRTNKWESGDNRYFQTRPHCQETDSCGLFVDIGANIGYWSLFMAHLGYDVLSFEAMVSNALMLYATLQDLVSPEIKERVQVFPVALSNVTRDSTMKCVMCSHDINTQDGHLICGENPTCHGLGDWHFWQKWGRYTERGTVDVFNLRYFMEDMFPVITNKENNLKQISNFKIDVEGHEPEVLYPILDLLQRGLIEKMFAECFGHPHDASFFENEIGTRMKLLNPSGLARCKSGIVNLKYERYPQAVSTWAGIRDFVDFNQRSNRRRLLWWESLASSPTTSEIKRFHFSTTQTVDGIKWSQKMRNLQVTRERRTAHVHVNPWQQTVLFAHHDPRVDLHVSGALSRGSMFEENAVVAVAKHLDLIFNALQVPKDNIAPHRLGFIDIGANLGVYSVGLGARFLRRFPSLDIFAFEPSDDNLALLTSSIRQNKLSNIHLFPYGLTESGNLGDTVSFVIDAKNKGHNHVEGDHSWSEVDGQTVKIETVPLDVFNKILENRHPEMYQSWSNAVWLKMDTEGLEPYIIRGGQKSLFSNSEMDPCFIKLEFAKHKEEIYTLLVDAGYEMVHFDWNSIAQHRVYSRQEAINKPDWDATFAKKDAGKCVRRKLENAHGTSADIEKQKQMKIAKCSDRVRPLPVIDHREELGNILEAEGMTVGLEVGVKQGEMSAAVLERWTKCENYYLMDPWEHQDHYQNGANVAQNVQDRYFQETKQRLKKFESRGVELHYIRDYSTNGHQEIADNSLDFVYIDARHDYQAMQQDLALFWPKLKCGGIFAGHDFCNANEEPGGRWCISADGTRCENGKAVKAAVEEFAAIHKKQIIVPRRETDYVTWYMRK